LRCAFSTRPSDWKMNPPRRNDRTAPLLLLFLGLLSLYGARQLVQLPAEPPPSCQEHHYIQIRGDIVRPGVYAFCSPPSIGEALRTAGAEGPGADPHPTRLRSGESLFVNSGGPDRIVRGEMSGFFKRTLGIPLSINEESETGLTALPDIGPGLARAIVQEREDRGGFKSVEELTSVPGIGPGRLAKIRPFVKL
jgi:competence protein ComEA